MAVRAKQELTDAWNTINASKSSSVAEVRQILSLTRVVLEQEQLRSTYPVLYLYCDWSAHWEIDRNATGREVISAISNTYLESLAGTAKTPNPVTGRVDPHSVASAGLAGIAPRRLRQDWLDFNAGRGIPNDVLNSYNGWHYLLGFLLTALVERPLSLGPFDKNGLPTERRNLKLYNKMLRASMNALGDPQLAPRSLRVEYGAMHTSGMNLENLPNDDRGNTIRAIANGFVWSVHSLPDTTVVILIMDDETRAKFLTD